MNLVPASPRRAGGEDRLAGFRPEHVDLGNGRPDGSLHARVEVVEYLGDEQLAHLTRKDAPLLALVPAAQHLRTGDELDLHVPQQKLHFFDAETEQRVA